MKNHHTIRIATRRDAAKLLEIYAPYVEKTAVTFEYEVPEVQEFEERIGHVLEKYPFLICEREGEIAGYAYAGVFKNRAAYRWAVETTVYVREDRKKMGIGRELYAALEKILSLQNILNLTPALPVRRRKTPGLGGTACSSTNVWDINSQESFISAGTSSAAGTIWCGWKNIWEPSRTILPQ